MGSLLKSSGPKRNTPASPQKPNEEREQTTAPSPPAVAPVELLRILAHPERGKIAVEVGGQRFSAISRVTERVTGQRILEVAAALLAFTGGLIATANGTKTLPAPTVKLTAWPRSAPPPTDRTAEAETPPPSARRPPR
ncbi:MAG: hypothetical protein ACE5G8_12495, partial [Anaerolineae bacterium]